MIRFIHSATLIITLGFATSVAVALPNKNAGLGINLTGLSY
ncbi:hypothetical protein [Lacimicrobium sp. SS2-24]|nr:hypothetical protein [Lacimicrobium sp. SS2-24]